MKMMKAITIKQYWAWAIMAGHKRVENRTWPTARRGLIAIHAGKSRKWLDTGGSPYEADDLVFGAVVAVGKLIACVDLADDLPEPLAWIRVHAHSCGPVCWAFSHVWPLETPAPASGAQGLWSWRVPRGARLVGDDAPDLSL